ncbi:MAG: outer membrane protein assembly factor BamE [Gammaproteobacteria bacterium]|nr:outer membrane protein assembly factor BamE [Gammaproteobacteria bacterium]
MIPKIIIPYSKNANGLIIARSFIAALSFAVILGACSVHRIDIQQGNVITQEMLEKLKIGMGKQQVSRLLGTPLIEDPFHKGRWDYIYKFVAGDTGEKQSSHITLFFDGENLTKIDIREAPLAEADVRKTTLKKR